MSIDPLLKENHFDSMVNSLATNKLVVFEQYQDKYSNLDCAMMILDLNNRDHFIDDDDMASLFCTPSLLYSLYTLENKFGKKWNWIEQHLRNNPLFRGHKITQKTILKMSIFLHMLMGERLIMNYKQILPYDRVANLSFMPAESEPCRKRGSVGRKKKSRESDKEEQNYRVFVDRIEREKTKLNFQVVEDEVKQVGSLFFNKVKFHLQERSAAEIKRFRPSSSSWNNWKVKDSKAELLTDRAPDSIPNEERRPSNVPANYQKYLKKSNRL